jgi:hypothetical protein
LLSEQEVSKSWRHLFAAGPLNEETFTKAEALIEELRPENPLRHRLGAELAELRRLGKGVKERRRRVKVS